MAVDIWNCISKPFIGVYCYNFASNYTNYQKNISHPCDRCSAGHGENQIHVLGPCIFVRPLLIITTPICAKADSHLQNVGQIIFDDKCFKLRNSYGLQFYLNRWKIYLYTKVITTQKLACLRYFEIEYNSLLKVFKNNIPGWHCH